MKSPGDPFCSSAANELRKLRSHLADKLILFDKQLKSICKRTNYVLFPPVGPVITTHGLYSFVCLFLF